jgi:hypothetical protein
MSDPLNNMKYTQFVRQARGLGIDDLHVSRGEKKDKVVLKYHGIARNKTRINGEWSIPRADEAAGIKTFLERARKDFFVRRGEGLTGDAFKDEKQDTEVKPIVASDAPSETK